MQSILLELVCCPVCGKRIQSVGDDPSQGVIWNGCLVCSQCGKGYPVINGIPHLYIEDELWQSKAREAQGWISLYQDAGAYEGIDINDSNLPYYPDESWQRFAKNFDAALVNLELSGTEIVIDLGAGRGWAAKHFAQAGCRVVAVDIFDDERIGLGRAWALMKDANVYFDPLVGDGERLPFFPSSIDIVFCSATLHHSSNMKLLLENIYRVLKPGGRLCAINEPAISILESEETLLAQSAAVELQHGINENRPNLLEYFTCLKEVGFGKTITWKTSSLEMSNAEMRDLARTIGIIRPNIDLSNGQATVIGWARYLLLHLRTLTARRIIKSMLTKYERENLVRLLSIYETGDISFITTKPKSQETG